MPTCETSIMQRLRTETAAEHKVAESSPFERALVQGRLPRAAYVEYLAQRLVVHAVLERGVLSITERDARFRDVITPELLQEQNLEDDLVHFGVDPTGVDPCAAAGQLIADLEYLRMARPTALFGSYYVLEGSKNGARYIARAVRDAYGLTNGSSLRYLDPHGDQQRTLWQAFGQRMDAVPLSAGEADGLVNAAQAMFRGIRAIDDEVWRALCEADASVRS